MDFVTDLHLHSKYSRAVSQNMTLPIMAHFAKVKGLDILSASDWMHPLWLKEIKMLLEEKSEGLYGLKKPAIGEENIRFLLSTEIASIYKQGDKLRRIHNLIFSPSFETSDKINTELLKRGCNISSDGRPIVGLTSKQLLEIILAIDKRSMLIPAHIWTPWFSIFGSKSGFDQLTDAFEELTPHIYAVESGLSSDPFMNWRLKQLTGITIVSNSDAHSAAKLGREANILNCELEYASIIDAIKSGDERFVGTIEFFPEEGKYHYDGHAKCNISLSPTQSKKTNNLCPKCGKMLIIGVMNRVDQLADFTEDYKPKKHKTVEYIVPLEVILSEVLHVGTQSKKLKTEYEKILFEFDDEFSFLRKVSTKQIEKSGRDDLALALTKMRAKDLFIKPGYDGVYGIVKLLP